MQPISYIVLDWLENPAKPPASSPLFPPLPLTSTPPHDFARAVSARRHASTLYETQSTILDGLKITIELSLMLCRSLPHVVSVPAPCCVGPCCVGPCPMLCRSLPHVVSVTAPCCVGPLLCRSLVVSVPAPCTTSTNTTYSSL